jgi:hypothetical protein
VVGLGALLAAAAYDADPGGGGSTDALLALWATIERAGVPFLLFLAVAGLFTGQVFSRRQAEQLLTAQKDQADANAALLTRLWQEEKARADRLEQLLFQQTVLANRVGAVAERVAERTPGGGAAGG